MVRKLTLAFAVIIATLMSLAPSYAREWAKLGERRVSFRNDHDTVDVGRHEGKFKRLAVHIREDDIELESVKVVFASGEVEDFPFHERVRAGGESPPISLKTFWHDGRYIKEVILHYHSKKEGRGEAIAELWGQED